MKGVFLILSLFILSSCGVVKLAEETRDEVKATNAKMDVTNSQMHTTNEAVHLQTLSSALQGLRSTEATQNLQVPALMMAYAEIFAKEATPEEIIKLFHTYNRDMTMAYVGDGRLTDENLRVKGRMISYVGASLIAAFTPIDKLNTIMKEQVEEGGEYQDSAYIFNLCRYIATQDYLMGSKLRNNIANLDSLRSVVADYKAMKEIAKKPYVSDIKLVIPKVIVERNEKGDINSATDLEKTIDPVETAAKGRTAKRYFERKLNKDLLKTEEVKALLQEFNF